MTKKTKLKIDSWRDFFPFEKPRNNQIEAIEFVLDAFLNKENHSVILEASVGLGKSAIAITVARFLDAFDRDDAYAKGAYFITTQKILQQQYMRDFAAPPFDMKTIKSANTYKCTFHTKQTCAESRRVLNSLGERAEPNFARHCKGKCPYICDKCKFLDARLSVTNYSYFLAESTYAKQITPRQLIVFDEAHTIDDQCSKHIEFKITEKFARSALGINNFPQRPKSVAHVIDWMKDVYKQSIIKKLDEIVRELAGTNDFSQAVEVTQRLELLDKHICKLNRMLGQFDKDNWVLFYDEKDSGGSWTLKPVDVAKFCDEYLYAFGKRRLYMSATILDHKFYSRLTGIKSAGTSNIVIGSSFKKENRPIHYLPVGKMSLAEIDKTLPKVVEMIKLIMQQHKNEKGLLHVSNFKVADYISKNIQDDRLLIQTRDADRTQVLDAHLNSHRPTVLISPSMTEGVDLKDDLSRFQVFVKLPFPNIGDPLIVKKMKKFDRWLDYTTSRTIIQATGRSIRSEDDHAVTYILDGCWEKFYRDNEHIFPQYFKDAIVKD